MSGQRASLRTPTCSRTRVSAAPLNRWWRRATSSASTPACSSWPWARPPPRADAGRRPLRDRLDLVTEVFDSLLDALRERNLWLPTQAFPDLGGGYDAALLLPRASRAMLGLGATAGGAGDHLVELVDVGLALGADVETALDIAAQRPDEGLDHVADIDVVAGLQTVAVDDGGAALDQGAAEDGDHPSLAVGVLPRPVDVGQAEGGAAEVVERSEAMEVVLDRELGGPIR